MYIKLVNTVGTPRDGYILEGKQLNWAHITDPAVVADEQSCLEVGDYGLYEDPNKIRLVIVLDKTTILLERGDVYVMNDSGKTVDSIHA